MDVVGQVILHSETVVEETAVLGQQFPCVGADYLLEPWSCGTVQVAFAVAVFPARSFAVAVNV